MPLDHSTRTRPFPRVWLLNHQGPKFLHQQGCHHSPRQVIVHSDCPKGQDFSRASVILGFFSTASLWADWLIFQPRVTELSTLHNSSLWSTHCWKVTVSHSKTSTVHPSYKVLRASIITGIIYCTFSLKVLSRVDALQFDGISIH